MQSRSSNEKEMQNIKDRISKWDLIFVWDSYIKLAAEWKCTSFFDSLLRPPMYYKGALSETEYTKHMITQLESKYDISEFPLATQRFIQARKDIVWQKTQNDVHLSKTLYVEDERLSSTSSVSDSCTEDAPSVGNSQESSPSASGSPSIVSGFKKITLINDRNSSTSTLSDGGTGCFADRSVSDLSSQNTRNTQDSDSPKTDLSLGRYDCQSPLLGVGFHKKSKNEIQEEDGPCLGCVVF